MEALQAHNPENNVLAGLAASGVTHPGYGPSGSQGTSTAQQMEEARRAILRNQLSESQASPDILDRAISDSPEQQAQTPGYQQGYAPQQETHPPGYGPQATPSQYPPQQQQYAPQAYAPAPGQPSYDDLLHGLNRSRREIAELAQDREALGAIRELLQDDPEFAQEFLARISGQPVAPRSAPAADPNAPPPAASPQQRQGPDPYARAAFQRIKRLEGALEQQAQARENDRRQMEARELAETMPALFNYEATEAYRQQNGFRSLKDAFYHRLGNAVTFLNAQQQAQARTQQYAPQGGYAPQQQQQYGGAPQYQQYPQQQAPQYGPPQGGYAPQYGPPPAQGDPRQMVVMSPGGAPPGPAQQQQRLEQIKSFRPQNKDELKAKLRAYASATGMR